MKPIQLARCVIVDDYERILLLHNFRAEGSHWDLPGGLVEEGQIAEEAAIDAAQDLLGTRLRLVATLGTADFTIEEQEFRSHWFLAVIDSGEPVVNTPDIYDDLDYFDLDDLLSLSLSEDMVLLVDKIAFGEVVLNTGK